MCGFSMSIGSQYLVYAHSRDGELGTSICSRTKPVELAIWDRYDLPDPLWTRPGHVWSRLSFADLVAAASSANFYEYAFAFDALASVKEERDEVVELFRAVLRGGAPKSITVLYKLRNLGDDWILLEPDVRWLVENGTENERTHARSTLAELLRMQQAVR
jgi:hypothetical protein